METADGANGWQFQKNSSVTYLQCLRDGYKATSSKAFTPEFFLDGNKAYKISYKAQCSNKSNVFGYRLTVGGDGDAGSWEKELIDEQVFSPSANDKDEIVELVFTPANTGNARFCWTAELEKLGSSYYQNIFRVSEVAVTEIPVVPVCATGLAAEADPAGALSVKLSWTNPEVSETGLPVGEITASVYRDGLLVATVGATAGAGQEFIDDDSKGLSAGYHTYKVVIDNAAGHTEEAPQEVTTEYVGKGILPDYTADFDADRLKFLAVEPDPAKANGKVFLYKDGKFVLKENPKEISDGLIMPLVELKAGHVYEISVVTAHSSYYDIDFDIALSARSNPMDFGKVVATSNFKKGTTTARFAVEESGEFFPVLVPKALTSGYSEYEYVVSGFGIADVPLVPAAPADFKAKSDFANGRVDVSWTMPLTTSEGAPLTATLSGRLYRGASVAEDAEPTATFEVMPGEKCTWADETPETGLNSYILVIANPGDGDLAGGETEPLTVVSDYHAFAREIPYQSDFTTEAGREGWTFLDESRTKGTAFGFNDDNCLYLLDGTSATSSGNNLNDWIVCPLFVLEEGVTYTIEFEAKGAPGSSSYYMPAYNIYMSDEPVAESLLAGKKLTPSTAPKLTGEFKTYAHDFSLSDIPPQAPSRAEGESQAEVAKANKFVGLHFGLGNYSYPEVTVKSINFISDKPVSGLDNVAVDRLPDIVVSEEMIKASSETAVVELFDMTGKRLAVARGSLDSAALISGIYVVRVTEGGKACAVKYVKR